MPAALIRFAAASAALVFVPLAPLADAAMSSDGGLRFESEDSAYTFDLGGRIMWDVDSFDGVLNPDHDGERRLNTRLRRARIELSGSLPEDFDWVFDVDYVDTGPTTEAEIHSAGLRYSGWPVADVFIGRDKEPFGLEELTSSKALSLMRRNLLAEATDADSQPYFGIRFDGMVGPIGWSAGAFVPNGRPRAEDGGDRVAYTARVFGAPILKDDQVLHLGIAYTDRGLDQAEEERGFLLRIAESGDGVGAGTLVARSDRQLGLEALYLNGPFSLQGEHFERRLDGAEGARDAQVRSSYIQGTWTVSGESRGYSRETGVPGMIKPAGSRGAVELAVRWEHIVFDRPGMANPGAQVYTAGVNWYPNRNVKLMLNVTELDTSTLAEPGMDDDGLVVSGRVQFAF